MQSPQTGLLYFLMAECECVACEGLAAVASSQRAHVNNHGVEPRVHMSTMAEEERGRAKHGETVDKRNKENAVVGKYNFYAETGAMNTGTGMSDRAREEVLTCVIFPCELKHQCKRVWETRS